MLILSLTPLVSSISDCLLFGFLKVHIVRARSLTKIDGATSLPNLNSNADPINGGTLIYLFSLFHAKNRIYIFIALKMIFVKPEEDLLITERMSGKYLELVCADQSDQKEDTRQLDSTPLEPEDESDDSSLEIIDVIRFSESVLSFKDVKDFKGFHIHVDGLMIDAEIPTHLRKKYHELCSSQNTFLHEKLMQGFNTKLAAGMICETVNIAAAIRAAKPSTSSSHLQSWDKTLKAFEDLGMVVGFLRARIDKLLCLPLEVQAKIELKSIERDEAKEEMRSLKMKLLDVEMRIESLDDEIGGLVVKKEKLTSVFKEVAGASW